METLPQPGIYSYILWNLCDSIFRYKIDIIIQTSPLWTPLLYPPPCSLAEMSLGVLDEENFRRCCQLLLQQSERLRDGWSWEAVQVRRSVLSLPLVQTEPESLPWSINVFNGSFWIGFRVQRRATWGRLLSGQSSLTRAQGGTRRDQVQTQNRTLPVSPGLTSRDRKRNRWKTELCKKTCQHSPYMVCFIFHLCLY